MDIDDTELHEVAIELLGSMLADEVTPAPPRGRLPGRDCYRGRVELGGPAPLAVVLTLPPRLARRIAAQLLGGDPARLAESDVRDAVGELANIAAGRLKPLLPGGSELTVPRVSRGLHQTAGEEPVADLRMRCRRETLCLQVLRPVRVTA